MSCGMMCLKCRRYMEGDQRCRCPRPQPSEDAQTQISMDRCAICGAQRPKPEPPGPPPVPRQWYCLKHRDLMPPRTEHG